jgi:thiamine-phosphate pyrophosphorylase
MTGIHCLYVIIDPEACRAHSAVETARLALEGGARVIQWRDKRREKGDQLPEAHAVREFCLRDDVLFIANDHVDLALAIGANGVHLGQHDLPVDIVRTFVPHDFIVGASTNNAEEARRAVEKGASYVAIGSVFPTGSKEPERTRAASVDRIREVKAAVDVPVVAIGGINASNVDEVIAAGADAVAVISAVCGVEDPRAAAAQLAARFPS